MIALVPQNGIIKPPVKAENKLKLSRGLIWADYAELRDVADFFFFS